MKFISPALLAINFSRLGTVLMVILVILIILLVALYFVSGKLERKQFEQQKVLEATAQVTNMLVIDKKHMPLKEAPFPKNVYEQTPFYLRWMKVDVVKAKIGPKVFTLMAEKQVFKSLPVMGECRVRISGIYITEILKGAVVDEAEIAKRTKANAKAAKKAEKAAAKAKKK